MSTHSHTQDGSREISPAEDKMYVLEQAWMQAREDSLSTLTGTKLCKKGLNALFTTAAMNGGRRGVSNLCSCIRRQVKEVASKYKKMIVLREHEVLEMMGIDSQDGSSWYDGCSISLKCDAFATSQRWSIDGIPQTQQRDSGWKITGVPQTDFYCDCGEFKAVHARIGAVWSNPERDNDIYMEASSERALRHFWNHHGTEFYISDIKDV